MRLELDLLSPTARPIVLPPGMERVELPVELVVDPASWAVRMRWAVEHDRLTINQARDMVGHRDWLPEHFHARLDALGVPRDIEECRQRMSRVERARTVKRVKHAYLGETSRLRRIRNALRRR